jgi:hypothetical protein
VDDEDVEHEFFGMAMGDYADSIDRFIEYTRITRHDLQETLTDGDDLEKVAELSANLFRAVSSVQIGNVPNLLAGYAHALNVERAAGIEVFLLANAFLDRLRTFHRHLVDIGQPNEELLMVTDLMNDLQVRLDETSYGRMAKERGDA